MRLTDPPALVALSSLVWVTLLVVIRNRVAIAVGVVCLALLIGILQNIEEQLDTASVRCLGWVSLAVAAAIGFATATSQKERNTTAFVSFGALCLFVASIFEDTSGSRWLALIIGVASWLAVGSLFPVLRGALTRRANTHPVLSLDSLRGTYDVLHDLPSAVLDRKADDILRALPADVAQFTSIATLSRHLDRSWQEVWIICALLNEIGLVDLITDQPLYFSQIALTPDGIQSTEFPPGDSDTKSEVHLPSITILNNVVVEKGGTIVEGDSYKVSGANVTGAFGRNHVRDIYSQASGGQAVTISEVVTEARALAQLLPDKRGQELRDASHDIETTTDESELRHKLQRLMGIAALIGSQGQPLLDLARRAIESITH